MAAADIVRMGEVRDGSSNNDEHVQEGEMQDFVQQHLLGFLQPVNVTLQDLQEQIHRLRRHVLERHVSIDESLARVERHEQSLQTLSRDLSATNQKSSRMHAELSQIAELSVKALRERFEAFSARMDEQQQHVASRTCDLEAWKSEAADTDNGHIGQLQRGLADCDGRTTQMEREIIDMRKAVEDVHHQNLGLSQRFEQSKMKLDDATKDLDKVIGTTTTHIEESKIAHAGYCTRVQNLEQRLIVACFDMENQGKKMVKAEAQLVKVWSEVSGFEDTLQAEEKKQEQAKEEILQQQQRQGMGTKDAIQKLLQAVDSLDVRLTDTSKGASDMVKYEIKRLDSAVDDNTRRNASNAAEIRDLHQHKQVVDGRLNKIEENQSDHAIKQNQLLARSNVAMNDLTSLTTTMNVAEDKLLVQEQKIEKATARIGFCEKGIQDNGENLSALFADLASTNEKMTRTSNRLNLAHGQLKGMTKGISEAQRRAADALDGMLSPEKLQEKEIYLPSLSGSPLPIRPASSMV